MKVIRIKSGELVYSTPRGILPSVTTILNATMPAQKKESLLNWRKNLGAQAEQISQQALAKGRRVHKMIEKQLKGEQVECPEELNKIWEKVQETLSTIDQVNGLEEKVYHSELLYAGRFDLLAQWYDELTIVDFKTSGREKAREWLTDEFLQLAAYRGAYHDMYNNRQISRGVVIVISPEIIQSFELDLLELDHYWDQWLKRLEQYKQTSLE